MRPLEDQSDQTSQRGIRPKELRELLADYRAGEDQQALLVELADPRGAFGWYRDYADVLPGPQRDYLIMEAAASKITTYEAQRIPGLLQTPRLRARPSGDGPVAGRRHSP